LVVNIREKVREFKAERMLTKDNNVPVTIDAILHYKIIEERARDAILNVENFNEIIQQVAQTMLRNNIGSSVFQDIYIYIYIHTLQEGRGQAAHQVGYSKRGRQLGHRSDGCLDPVGDNPAGARSSDVDAGAGRQAEREKSTMVTYSESEVLIAKQFEEASKVCTLTTRWRTHSGSRTCCI
jgi:SPFH domain / Band 7 family